MRFHAIAAAVGMALVASSLSHAVTVTTFDTFTPNSYYGSWSAATTTSEATDLREQATGFGGAYTNIPNVNGAGTDTIQLKATVDAGVAGFIVALGDTTGHEWNYAWYGNTAGTYTLTHNIATPNFSTGASGQLDLANIDFIQIQVDPGTFGSTPYNVSFNDLQVIATPEPASLAACAVAGLLGIRRRR